ncbi:MAG: haloacid dehalogenase-like hydrolase [bacterium]
MAAEAFSPTNETIVLADFDNTLLPYTALARITPYLQNHGIGKIDMSQLQLTLKEYKQNIVGAERKVLQTIASGLAGIAQATVKEAVQRYYQNDPDNIQLFPFVEKLFQDATDIHVITLEPDIFLPEIEDTNNPLKQITLHATQFAVDEQGNFTGEIASIPEKGALTNEILAPIILKNQQRKLEGLPPISVFAMGDHHPSDGPMLDAVNDAKENGIFILNRRKLDQGDLTVYNNWKTALEKGYYVIVVR